MSHKRKLEAVVGETSPERTAKRCRLEVEKPEIAITLLLDAIGRDPSDSSLSYRLARIYQKGSSGCEVNPKEAVRWFEVAAKQGDVFAMANLVYMYRHQKENKVKCMEWLKKIPRVPRPYVKDNCILGQFFLDRNDTQSALVFAKAAMKQEGQNECTAKRLVASILFAEWHYVPALGLLEPILERKKQTEDDLRMVVQCYVRLANKNGQDPDEKSRLLHKAKSIALEWLTACSSGSKTSEALLALGQIQLDLGEIKEGEAILEQASALGCKDSMYALYRSMWSRYQKKKKETKIKDKELKKIAKTWLQKAASLGHWAAHFELHPLPSPSYSPTSPSYALE